MLRRNVRRLFKLYERFMSRPGSMALCPGATPEDLAAVEQALGLRDGGGGGGGLPAEVWELYRHRNGQAPGAFVTFVDDMRLLGLHELAVEVAPGLPELQQRLAALGRPHSPQPQRPALAAAAAVPAAAGGGAAAEASGTAAAATTAVPPSAQSGGNLRAAQEPEPQADQAASGDTHAGGPGELESGARAQGHGGGAAAAGTGGADGGLALSPAGGQAPAGGSPQPDPQLPLPPPPPALLADDRVVAVAANASGSRRFVVALGTGHVYIARGLSFAFYAPGVAALLQKLLA
ncbi:hypothetical protein HXX76_004641 [Chlamydomonas incerta]|uniref:Uncharacterized protein n=1 Tax=Chlamydomonas incerta TaxID=51695 RepID=A0A835TIZ7_CHLIN|nr:hypothetical protein HXX76_004641 [Chlamydomonas incerta]|eukprot:KAG2439281.1 hypothetical protein HXX76_004641 [Chlamydomonas incerta]